RYTLLHAPDGDTSAGQNLAIANIGLDFHGPGASGGTGGVVEGNRVYHTRFASYGDFYSSKDFVIRNNYFHDVVCGIYQNMGGPSQPVFYGSSTLTCGGTTTATFVANLAHGLLTKSGVIVRGAIVNSSVNNPFNGFPDNPGGYFEVESVPPMPADANGRPTSFTYKMSAVPAADATPGSATYAEFWRIRRLVVENNVIELAPTPSATHAQSVGI